MKHGPLYELVKEAAASPWFNDLLNQSFILKVGSGNKIRFWEDQWVETEVMRDKFPRLYSLSSQ